jgi:hypothetical protein
MAKPPAVASQDKEYEFEKRVFEMDNGRRKTA